VLRPSRTARKFPLQNKALRIKVADRAQDEVVAATAEGVDLLPATGVCRTVIVGAKTVRTTKTEVPRMIVGIENRVVKVICRPRLDRSSNKLERNSTLSVTFWKEF